MRDTALAPLRAVTGSVFVFSAGVAVLLLASPIYMLQVYDRVLTTRHVETLISLSVLLAVSLAVLAGLDALRALILGRAAAAFEDRVAPLVLDRSIARAARTGGARSAQPLRDVAALRGFIAGNLVTAFDLPFVPLFFAALFLIHPALGVLVTIGGVVALVLAVVNDRVSRRAAEHADAAGAALLEEADAVVRNADVVVGMGLLPPMLDRRRGRAVSIAADQRRTADLAALFAAGSRFVRYFLQSAVLGLAAALAISDQITAGTLIAATTISARAVGPLEQAVAMWRGVQQALFAWKRLSVLFEEDAVVVEATRLPRPTGALRVEKLIYTPIGAKAPILKGLGFAVAPGAVLGVVGPAGGGKSTLARLLVGSLRPGAGSVRLDGAEIGRIHPADRLAHVGYLPQDVELLPGTVRETIARFMDADDAAVVEAARLVGAHEMILALPQGYETRIGHGGVPLSGGQRQRIGLARAVFGGPALLVLDEPNASLDAAGEADMLTGLTRLKARGTSVVLVTHRLSALVVADEVMVLRDGAIDAIGPRDEILARLRAAAAAPRAPAATSGSVVPLARPHHPTETHSEAAEASE